MPTQKTLYLESLKNPDVIKETFASLFFFTASDYYPEISVEITELNGSKIKIFSDSQTMLSLPWQINRNGRKTKTFNAHISHAISNLMPEKSANKRRLIGEDLRGEVAKAVMDEIEDKWNLLEAEEQVPKTLKELRKDFEVQTAFNFVGSEQYRFVSSQSLEKGFSEKLYDFCGTTLRKRRGSKC